MKLTESDADRSIAVTAGDEVTITLSENRTAGYQWSVEATTGGVTVVSSDFEASSDGRPGAGGHRTLVVRAASPGAGEVRLRYQRSWKADAGSGRQCRFTFEIKSA
jgi:predicted secreted protein